MRPVVRVSLATASFLLSQIHGASAQSEDEAELALAFGDRTTVSIATGAKQSLRRAPAVASVITAEEIAAMGATDLDQVLETVPGVHVNNGASMHSSQYVIRGVYSLATPQVLMLQNGIPVTTLLVGGKGNLWGGLPLENVARIEIIRGPGSALYGADAYSGVINIITKTAEDIHGTDVGARIGSFSSRDAWLQHGGSLGPISVAAYLRTGTTDGFKQTVAYDAQTRNDAIFHTHASLAPGQTNTGVDSVDGSLDLSYGNWRWRTGYKLRDNMGTYIGLGSALDPLGRGMSERITSDLGWTDDRFAENWGVAVNAAFMQYKQRYTAVPQILPPGATLPTGVFPNGMFGAPETSERQVRLSAAATYTGFAGHSLRLGLGHDDLNMYGAQEWNNFLYQTTGPSTGVPIPNGPVVNSSVPFMFPHRRLVNYVYAQDEWQLARDWMLTMGLRHDNYSVSGGTTNPRLALVWDARLDFTAKLLYGQAYRAPAFTEQYAANNPISAGNSSLRPETNRTWEAAFSWQVRNDWQLGMNVFRYAMKDIIRAVANPPPATGTTFANTGQQHGSGMELETTWDAGRRLRFTGNYSYQRSIDDTTHQDAGYAPHHQIYARADWRFSDTWLASSQVNWVADRKRAVGDTRPAVPDYTTVDLTLRTQRGNHEWDFAASIRNLFNADVREPSLYAVPVAGRPDIPTSSIPNDLPQAGRSLYLQAVYSL
jgi:iron complex outermembrane receptor protein